ncbi:unnamed protein product [Brachionus calyciflorus]|uniref:Peptidase A9 domain-containing protein n=1 Tax=Brachionus calyciflorus TaxID=104777 RepID=A0A814JH34_9BILA|nr:unnamed protein product [Brachionus calyciflorus]
MDLLVDNGASNSLLKFSSLPNEFKQVIQNFCLKHEVNQDLKNHSIGIKTCNGDSFCECVVARVWLTIGTWSGEHQFIISDNITNQDGILGRDFLMKYETVIDNRNDSLRISSNPSKNFISTNNCQTTNLMENYFIETKTMSKPCFLTQKQNLPKDSESILEVQLENMENFDSNMDVIFEPAHLNSIVLAHSVNKVEDGKIFISAINLSDREIKNEIKSGQVLGSANKIDIESVMIETIENVQKTHEDVVNIEIKNKINEQVIDSNLKEQEVNELKNLIFEFKDCFSCSENDLGKTNLIKHQINTGSSNPVKQPPYRVPSFIRNEIDKEIDKML